MLVIFSLCTLTFFVGGCGSGSGDPDPSGASGSVEQDSQATIPATGGSSSGSEAGNASSTSARDETPPLPVGREWKNAAGQVVAVGDFVSVLDDNVCLQKSDGGGIKVPLDQLCASDRAFALNGGETPTGSITPPGFAPTLDEELASALDAVLDNSPNLAADNPVEGRSAAGNPVPPSNPVELDSPHGRDEIIEDLIVDGGGRVTPGDTAPVESGVDNSFDMSFDERGGDEEPGSSNADPSATGNLQRPPRDESADYEHLRVVIPFNFVSEFDDGRYGSKVGEMIWTKLDREGGVVIPESTLDVDTVCDMLGVTVGPDMPLEEVGRIVREEFEADIGIWGSMERVPGFEWDVYDFTIYCVDFSDEEPNILYEVENARTEVVSEVPYIYIKTALDRLYGRRDYGPTPEDPIAEEKWRTNPNLIVGGDFQRGSSGVPMGWEGRAGQFREPLGGLASWTSDASEPENRIIRFRFDAGVGNGYGVMYYSHPTPIDEGATYRFQCRWRSNGPAVKIFIKCYDLMDTGYIVEGNDSVGASAQYESTGRQLRECYRAQFNLSGPKNTWNTHTQDFTPRHTKYTPRFAKVDLYAYLGAGVVDFDDVIIREIIPTSPGDSEKDRRHSMDSGVTLENMRENEERVREAQEERERELQEQE